MNTLKQILFLTPISTFLWLSIIAVSILFVSAYDFSWFLVPFLAYTLLLLHEIVVFFFINKALFPSAERTARAYQWLTLFWDDSADIASRGDLTEGYYNGDFLKDIEQATIDKYEEIIKLLEIKKGDRVLDVGCGLGDFLFYLKRKGIEGVGLTISPEQYQIGLKRGLDVRIFDFRKKLPEELENRFDAVTFIGSLEHFPEAYFNKNRIRVMNIFENVFESASKALSNQSKVQRMFSATLHCNKNHKWRLKDYLHGYLLQGHYSGLYPIEGEFEVLSKKSFKVMHKYDATIDYQYSSLACSHHFGHFKINWTHQRVLYSFLLFLVNPFALSTWLYHISNTWMWQFGGLGIVPEANRPAKALWYVLEKI